MRLRQDELDASSAAAFRNAPATAREGSRTSFASTGRRRAESEPVLTAHARQRLAAELRTRSIAGRRPAISVRHARAACCLASRFAQSVDGFGRRLSRPTPVVFALALGALILMDDGWGRREASCPSMTTLSPFAVKGRIELALALRHVRSVCHAARRTTHGMRR